MNLSEFVKERDAAFIDFVKTGNVSRFERYCKKYDIPLPENKKVMAAGIYKAVQECTGIPKAVKVMAAAKCMALGMSPFIF